MSPQPPGDESHSWPAAYDAFQDAVLDLSEDPSAASVARYLAASRALDEAQRSVATQGDAGARAA